MKNYRILVFLLLTSLTIRLFCYFSSEIVMGNDAIAYVKLARHLASGDWRLGLDPYWSPLLPILTAIVSVFSDSLVLPISTISIFAGSLAVVVTYYLVKQSYGEREAVIAAVIAAFYPHLLNSTFYFGTEEVYLLLINFALITSWKGLFENSRRNFLVTGLLLGLAYLTRPEAFGYLIFFVPLAFSKAFMGQKAFSQNHTKSFLAILLGFFLLATPYILYIRSETGYWTISTKLQQHVIGGNFGEFIFEKPDISKSKIPLIKSVITNLHTINKVLPLLFPPLLLILLSIGLFRKSWTVDNYKREIFLLVFCAVTVLCYVINVVEVRYFYVLLPILFGWLARGIVEMEDWLLKTFQNLSINVQLTSKIPVISILLIILIYFYTLPMNIFMHSEEKAWLYNRYEEKYAGVWLKEYATSASNIMSLDVQPAFYAGGKHIPFPFYAKGKPVSLPLKNVNDVIKEAVSKHVDFLVIDERHFKNTPLNSLLTEPQNYPELELIYQNTEQKGYKIVIYKVKKDNIP
jgi:hypothetical protein